MTLKIDLIKNDNKVFIETGTFNGGGVINALNEGYQKIISIEIYDPMYQECLQKFEGEIRSGRVQLHHGDSSVIIGKIVSQIDEPITYWFDAHDQSMNGGGVGKLKCPIIVELEQIIANRPSELRKKDVILIDDMRLIEASWQSDWGVDMTKFYGYLWEYNKDFIITREEGHIPGDILMCRPRIFSDL